jgi:predicted deacylase
MKKIISVLFVCFSLISNAQQGVCWYELADIMELVDSLDTHFPSICKRIDLGSSVEGRPIAALKISNNVGTDEPQPEILLIGCIHGSEKASAYTMCNLARELCLQYASNQQIQDLVNTREIWIIPALNPDGFIMDIKLNANWVDLNRDAGYMWTGSLGSSPGAFSQPESKIIRDFILSRNFSTIIDYHSGIQGIIYPWFYRSDACPDHNEVSWLANQYHDLSAYPSGTFNVTSGYDLYQTNGSVAEFAYGSLGIHAFAVELFSGWSGDGCMGMDYNRASIFMMIEKAGFGISGTVADATTGQPIAAKIHVHGKMPFYNSPSVGDYHKYLQPDTYTVTISANGYDSQTINNVVVTSGNLTVVNAQLTPNTNNQAAFKLIACKNIADDVVAADPMETWNITGIPDGLHYPLSDTGYVVLDIGANIVNVTGPDITVTGAASVAGNGYELFWSSTPDGPWALLGSGTSTQSFELGNVNNARYLKILDNGNGPGNVHGAGFHLDAVTVEQTTVGIDETSPEFAAFSVYPNPTQGMLNIRTKGIETGMATIQVFNSIGKQIASFPEILAGAQITIDLSGNPTGLYFMTIQNKHKSETLKIILK